MSPRKIALMLLLALVAGLGAWLQYTGKTPMDALAMVRPQLAGQAAQGQAAPAQQTQGQAQGQAQGQQQARPGAPAAGGPPGAARGPSPVETAKSQAVSLRNTITTVGTLEPEFSADIAPETNGRIVEIRAADGAEVKDGDSLFLLDGEVIAAEIKDAEARLALAESGFERNDRLRRSRNIAQSTFDESVAELTQAKSALELAKVRQSKLGIRAPFGGILGFVAVSKGAYVVPGQALVRLTAIDRLNVSFSVPELFFTSLKIGGKVELTADAVPGAEFDATISAIDPVVDANGRALKVLALMDNSARKLRPGMLARVNVLGEERKAITISESAVVPQGTQLSVYVVAEDKAKRLDITTGQRRDGWVEILSGLSEGQDVVIAGAARLADGAAVKVVKGDSP